MGQKGSKEGDATLTYEGRPLPSDSELEVFVEDIPGLSSERKGMALALLKEHRRAFSDRPVSDVAVATATTELSRLRSSVHTLRYVCAVFSDAVNQNFSKSEEVNNCMIHRYNDAAPHLESPRASQLACFLYRPAYGFTLAHSSTAVTSSHDLVELAFVQYLKVMAVVELKAFIENVLGHKKKPYDRRTAWDTVWQEILKVIVDRGHLPDGTVHDIIPLVQEYIEEKEKQLSTIQEKCPSYLSSNRELSLVFSELWGDVTFKDGRHTYFHRESKGNPQHAEIQVLSYLSELQDGHRPRTLQPPHATLFTMRDFQVNPSPSLPNNRKLEGLATGNRERERAKLYMNVSPCRNCADAVVRFHRSNGDISLALTFSSLYAHHGENHRQGLQALAESGIQLAVFNENQWEALAHCIQNEEKLSQERTNDIVPVVMRVSKKRQNTDSLQPSQWKRKR
uniref:Cytidine deaminase n=1 Tax=Timema tahoe TaxID=61484 RepID=A0A7R9NZE5_9NEOP|nr:unnamed protein product [Timema tahoe]